MTTLETRAGTTSADKSTTKPAPAKAGVRSADTAAVITEQQVLFSSAAALAPAKHHHLAHALTSVRAMFVRPERAHVRRQYPQRFTYLESSAMSREMGRL
jgi:hypothetical protein